MVFLSPTSLKCLSRVVLGSVTFLMKDAGSSSLSCALEMVMNAER